MNADVNFIALITNGIITIFCGGFIFYSVYTRKFTKNTFYYLLGAGFTFFGVQILARAFFPIYFQIYIGLMIAILFLFSTAFWSLNRKRIFLFLFASSYFTAFLLVFCWQMNFISYNIGSYFGMIFSYVPLVIYVIHHRVSLGRVADKFILGWFLLFLTNFLTFGMGWITDVFAVFSKIVILIGVIGRDFSASIYRISRETAPRFLPSDTGYGEEGGVKLVFPPRDSSYMAKTNWVERKIQENLKKSVNTYIFSFQDIIPHSEMRRMKWIDPEKVEILLFSESADKTKDEFMGLPMGLQEIGATLSGVIKKYYKLEKGCTVIFTDLSLLIHVFGVYAVYNMLLNKMGSLREEKIDLFAFFHPETFSDKSVVSLFKNISNEVIEL